MKDSGQTASGFKDWVFQGDKSVISGVFVLFTGGRVCFGAMISGTVTLRKPAAGTAEQRGVSWCKKCYFGVFVEKVFSRDPGWGGYRKKRTGGGSGYDHPSPSIPLPVEGRGKPVAMRPGSLGALAASVTDLQTVTCIMGFLRVKQWEGGNGDSLPAWMPIAARTE